MQTTSSLLESIRKRREEEAKRQVQYARTSKPESGKQIYRILPSWRGAGQDFWHDFGMHYVRANPADKPTAYVCSNDTFGQPCDLCSAVHQAAGMPGLTQDDQDFYRGMRSTRRVLVNALHISGPEADRNKPILLELPIKVFDQIMSIIEEYEADITQLDPKDGGMNIVINREGTGINTKYSVLPAAKHHKIDNAVLSQLHNIDLYVKQDDEAKKKIALDKLSVAVGVLPASVGSSAATPKLARIVDDLDDAPPFDVSGSDSVVASDAELDELLKDFG